MITGPQPCLSWSRGVRPGRANRRKRHPHPAGVEASRAREIHPKRTQFQPHCRKQFGWARTFGIFKRTTSFQEVGRWDDSAVMMMVRPRLRMTSDSLASTSYGTYGCSRVWMLPCPQPSTLSYSSKNRILEAREMSIYFRPSNPDHDWAISMARSRLAALCSVSWYSRTGSESATMPAPTWA